MKPNPINQLAIWLPMKGEGLLVKAFNTGYPYMDGSIINRSTLTKPVYRYAKNYIKGKTKYSLCLISHESNTENMMDFMDEQAAKLKESDIKPKFTLLDVRYK